MISSHEFETGAEYADWASRNKDTQIISVAQSYCVEDAQWKTLVLYVSPIAVEGYTDVLLKQ